MEANFIFKNMDIKQSENSGMLIAKTKIWLPEKDKSDQHGDLHS